MRRSDANASADRLCPKWGVQIPSKIRALIRVEPAGTSSASYCEGAPESQRECRAKSGAKRCGMLHVCVWVGCGYRLPITVAKDLNDV